MSSVARLFVVFLALATASLGWEIPHINLPTYTYQCMPMEMSWEGGSPPYTIWFHPVDLAVETAPNASLGLGAWYNLTGNKYIVPCRAPAGSSLQLVLQDGTGWISTSPGTFVVSPSSDSSCIGASDDDRLAQSQSILSPIMSQFQQSVASAISVSATAESIETSIQEDNNSQPVPIETSSSHLPQHKHVALGPVLGPILGCLFGVVIGIALSVCYVRRRRQKPSKPDPISRTLPSTSAFDILEGESEPLATSRTQDPQQLQELGIANSNSLGSASAEPSPTTSSRTRLHLHDGAAAESPQSEKSRSNSLALLPPSLSRTANVDSSQARPTSNQNLEQRAEELSAPELERLAALVARRLERVRGAPPQYSPTDMS